MSKSRQPEPIPVIPPFGGIFLEALKCVGFLTFILVAGLAASAAVMCIVPLIELLVH